MTTPLDSTPPLMPDYKDRSTGLKTFGILVIILGAFCALSIPLTILGQVVAAKQQSSELDAMLLLPALLLLTILAGGLIWLGIGSIKARRWARALLLCLGWFGLIGGVFSLLTMFSTLSMLDQAMRQQAQGQAMPPAALLIAKIVTVTMTVVMYVIIPGAMVLFYGNRNVRLTCEQRDPVVRWTDRCPLPVLAIALVQALGALYLLPLGKFTAAIPFAGYIVTGWPARLIWMGLGGLMLYCAWGFYHLRLRAWLVYVVMIVVFALSTLVTFLRTDLINLYRNYGLSERQLELMASSPLYNGQGHLLCWIGGGAMICFLGYLLYLRRYFAAGQNPGPAA